MIAPNGRSGSALMIHGDCASVGCYAMTEEQIGEIYSLARKVRLRCEPRGKVSAFIGPRLAEREPGRRSRVE
jgi:murein L,D-transpeptidase YafK